MEINELKYHLQSKKNSQANGDCRMVMCDEPMNDPEGNKWIMQNMENIIPMQAIKGTKTWKIKV